MTTVVVLVMVMGDILYIQLFFCRAVFLQRRSRELLDNDELQVCVLSSLYMCLILDNEDNCNYSFNCLLPWYGKFVLSLLHLCVLIKLSV